ncbi:sedoheptulokinase [Lampetra fluviatilis]
MKSASRRHVGVEGVGVGGVEGAGLRLVLGVDVGTSSVKVAVLDPSRAGPVPLASRARTTRADVASREAPGHGREQNVGRIMEALEQCLLELPSRLLNRVGLVGVSGQMHGVVLWRSGQAWRYRPSKREAAAAAAADGGGDDGDDGADGAQGGAGSWFDMAECSRLITWEDARCSPDFLSTLPAPRPGACAVASGYGCATLLWLAQHTPGMLRDYDCAGTVQDLLVSVLCDLQTPVMTAHNAASWGYYNAQAGAWDMEGLRLARFPSQPLLPSLVPVGSVAGRTRSDFCGLPRGAEVGAALGDLQAAVYSCLERHTDAVLNISTSAQLVYVLPPGLHLPDGSPSPGGGDGGDDGGDDGGGGSGGGGSGGGGDDDGGGGGSGGGGDGDGVGGGGDDDDGGGGVVRDVFPYVGDWRLCVAASLNGGNVLAMFVDTLRSWVAELGLEPPSADDLYVTLNRLASDIEDEPEPPPDPSIRPGSPGKQDTPAPDPDPSIRPGAPGKQETPAPTTGAPVRAPTPAPRLTIRATVFGERASPESRGRVSLSGVDGRALSLGRVWRALCLGLVKNLAGSGVGRCGGRPPLPPGVDRVLAGGSALLRNATLARQAAVVLRASIVEASCTVDSAVGSARLLWDARGRGGGRGAGRGRSRQLLIGRDDWSR